MTVEDDVQREIRAARWLGAKSGWCPDNLLGDGAVEIEARRRIARRWHATAARIPGRRCATTLAAPQEQRGDTSVTFDEAEFLSRMLEVVTVDRGPEGVTWYAVLRGPENADNWPIDWFINKRDGDVLLVVGDGATDAEARLWAAGRIVDSQGWQPGMGLREAERALYPGLSAIDDEQNHGPDPGAK